MNTNAGALSLSVVIAAYNAEESVARAVKSAFDAGAHRVFVVDDGSDDRTADEAEIAGAAVIRQENRGAAAARERGAADVTSEFLIFLDADDQLVPSGVARSLALLADAPEASAAGGRVVGFSGSSAEELLPVTYPAITVDALLVTGFSAWPPAAAVIRVTKLQEAAVLHPQAIKPPFAEDYELLIRLARVGDILRHDLVSMRYEMSGGKSVRSARQALECKEQIREHYADAWDIEVRLLTAWRRRAAASKRVARARKQEGRRISALITGFISYAQGGVSLTERPRTAGGSKPSQFEVFEWAAGQDDNIGDSLLRRPSLADARSRGRSLHVFHGPSSSTFDDGLGLSPLDTTYRSFAPWLLAAVRRGIRRPTLLIPNAGEVKVSRRGALRLGLIWSASLLPHVRVLWMGAGIVGDRSLWALPYRLLARRAHYVTFRDDESVAFLRSGRTSPDWAFALGTNVNEWPVPADRQRLTLSLRGDRDEPSDAWLAWVSEIAAEHDLVVTFVSQVRRDNALSARLAARLGGESLLFDNARAHSDQEALVRAVYRQSRIVLGDRLHSLIVASTEGAVPLGWVESSNGKVTRHFNAVDMPIVGAREGVAGVDLPPVTPRDLAEWSASLPSQIEKARERIRLAQSAADATARRHPER